MQMLATQECDYPAEHRPDQVTTAHLRNIHINTIILFVLSLSL